MIEDRNLTSRMYHEGYADKVYDNLAKYLALFQKLLVRLKIKE